MVVKSDGSIWFTDPTYGIDSNYEGHQAESEIGANQVYRIDPRSGELSVVADDFVQPNGIAFSPDERRLYIVDTGASHVKDGPRHMRVFDVGERRRAERRRRRSPSAAPAPSTACAWTSRAASGSAPATGCTA